LRGSPMRAPSRILVGCAALACLALTAPRADAAFTISGSSGGHSASVEFSQIGSTLTVKLSNTSLSDAMVPTDVLTAVFFNTTPTGGNVGGAYAYKRPALGYNRGISSSGFGIFGAGDRFDTSAGSNLQGPDSPDGVQWGITKAGDNFATGNGAMMSNALVKSSVTFTFTVGGGLTVNEANIG